MLNRPLILAESVIAVFTLIVRDLFIPIKVLWRRLLRFMDSGQVRPYYDGPEVPRFLEEITHLECKGSHHFVYVRNDESLSALIPIIGELSQKYEVVVVSNEPPRMELLRDLNLMDNVHLYYLDEPIWLFKWISILSEMRPMSLIGIAEEAEPSLLLAARIERIKIRLITKQRPNPGDYSERNFLKAIGVSFLQRGTMLACGVVPERRTTVKKDENVDGFKPITLAKVATMPKSMISVGPLYRVTARAGLAVGLTREYDESVNGRYHIVLVPPENPLRDLDEIVSALNAISTIYGYLFSLRLGTREKYDEYHFSSHSTHSVMIFPFKYDALNLFEEASLARLVIINTNLSQIAEEASASAAAWGRPFYVGPIAIEDPKLISSLNFRDEQLASDYQELSMKMKRFFGDSAYEWDLIRESKRWYGGAIRGATKACTKFVSEIIVEKQDDFPRDRA